MLSVLAPALSKGFTSPELVVGEADLGAIQGDFGERVKALANKHCDGITQIVLQDELLLENPGILDELSHRVPNDQ